MPSPAEEALSAKPNNVAPLSENDVLKSEKEVLGFYFSGHPLISVQHKLKAVATHDISKLNPEITTNVRIAGILNQVKRMVTKSKGEQWASAELEDLSGEIRLLVFPRAYASGLSQALQVGSIMSASGRLSFKGEGPESAPELIVDELVPLDFALIRFGKKLRILAHEDALTDESLENLRLTLAGQPGSCPVVIEHETPDGTAVLEIDQRVRLSQPLLDAIEKIFGPKSWSVESSAPAQKPSFQRA